MHIILLYHAKANGFICKKIAKAAPNIVAVSDKDDISIPPNSVVVRWDSKKDLNSDREINTARAVALARNKRRARFMLTGICPSTWTTVSNIQYPCIVRPGYHYGGFRLFVCNNKAEVLVAIKKCGRKWYASKLINKETEYRVFVFNNKVIKVIRRWHSKPNAVAWNSHAEGKSIRVQKSSWSEKVTNVAIEAARRLGLDLCAVDVIVDYEKRPYVLEANTAPGLKREATIRLFAQLLTNAN